MKASTKHKMLPYVPYVVLLVLGIVNAVAMKGAEGPVWWRGTIGFELIAICLGILVYREFTEKD